ncbi:MAG: hypothetical protein MI724_07600, partial [Spirochaetales bacterium]|nr:hypothetical protein [Spirochaetales bacterium]
MMKHTRHSTAEDSIFVVRKPNGRRTGRRAIRMARSVRFLSFIIAATTGAFAPLSAQPRIANTVLDTISSDQASFRLVRAVEGLDQP